MTNNLEPSNKESMQYQWDGGDFGLTLFIMELYGIGLPTVGTSIWCHSTTTRSLILEFFLDFFKIRIN